MKPNLLLLLTILSFAAYSQNTDSVKKEPKYDYTYHPKNTDYIIVGNKSKYGVTDTLGQIVIPLKFDYITYANDGLVIVRKDNLESLINSKGVSIIDSAFSKIERFKDNKAIALLSNNSTTLVDTSGKYLFPPIAGHSITECKNGICKIVNLKTDKCGFIDLTGRFTIPCIYDGADYANELVMVKKNKKWGLYSKNNIEIAPIIYENIFSRSHNLFIVIKDDKHGVINAENKEIIACVYSYIYLHEKKYFLAHDDNDNYGVFNIEGKNTIPFEYKFFRTWNDRVFAAKNGKPVILDLETGTTTTVDADAFKTTTDLLFEQWDKQIFIKNNKYGVISIDTVVLVPATYDDLQSIYVSGEFIAKSNGKYGIIDSKETIKQPIEFDKIFLRKEIAELTAKNKKAVYYDLHYRDYDNRIPLSEDKD